MVCISSGNLTIFFVVCGVVGVILLLLLLLLSPSAELSSPTSALTSLPSSSCFTSLPVSPPSNDDYSELLILLEELCFLLSLSIDSVQFFRYAKSKGQDRTLLRIWLSLLHCGIGGTNPECHRLAIKLVSTNRIDVKLTEEERTHITRISQIAAQAFEDTFNIEPEELLQLTAMGEVQ
jgi:hypothetical protein